MTFFRINLLSAYLLVIGFSFSGGIDCDAAHYLAGNVCCPKCDPGTYVIRDCKVDTGTTCDNCPDGNFMDVFNALKKCFPCSACSSDPGLRMKSPCTSKRDETCEPLEGFWCMVFTGESCAKSQKHKSCRPGQFISQNGTALNDTECSDCSPGTFSNETLTTCRKHKQCREKGFCIKTPGTSSSDAECEECSQLPGILVGVSVGVLISVGAAVGFVLWKKKICPPGLKEHVADAAEIPEEKPLNGRERGGKLVTGQIKSCAKV